MLQHPGKVFSVHTAGIRLYKAGIEPAVHIDEKREVGVVPLETGDELVSCRAEKNVVVVRRNARDLIFSGREPTEDPRGGEFGNPVAAGGCGGIGGKVVVDECLDGLIPFLPAQTHPGCRNPGEVRKGRDRGHPRRGTTLVQDPAPQTAPGPGGDGDGDGGAEDNQARDGGALGHMGASL
jgi:hypothetical protein